MAINLNLPTMMGTPYTTEADKLISDIRSFQAPNIPTPPPTIPKLTGFGNKLARIGGFGDEPGELKTKEELEKMTQAEIDAYVRQRKQARRLGTSEALIQFGEALQGKPAAQNALAREQARKNLELQGQYQKEYENAIRMAEQTNPQQARLLRSLGLPGYINLQQKRAEQMLLGGGERKNVELYELVDENNNFLRNITEGEYLDFSAKKLLPKGSKLKRLPTGTEAAKTVKQDDVSELIKPLETRYDATIQLVDAIQGAANQIAKNPTAALAVGGVAQFADAVVQNIDAFTGALDDANKNEYYQEMLQGKYIAEDTGKDFTQSIKEISKGNAVLESKIRDLAYLFAAARGQEGRGLSDKDYENALRIVSGGVGAEGRIGVLQDVATRITDDVMGALSRKKTRYEYMADQPGIENKLYNKYITEIDALFSTPIPSFTNPLQKSTTDLSDEELLELYGQ